MKKIGYLLFAGFYYLFRICCRIKSKKVFAIMTHDSGRDGNVGILVEYLKDQKEGYSFEYLKRDEKSLVKNLHVLKGKLSFFITKSYHLATSEFIIMDNVFLPMAYLSFKKRVRVIQLWHGTGTIKKFGQDVNTGSLKELERRANDRITHLIVNSERTMREYSSAFGVNQERIFIYGLPRTDLFFDERRIELRKQEFYQEYPNLKGKKLVLYAPTFRDQEIKHPRLMLDTKQLADLEQKDDIFLFRLHPFVAKAQERLWNELSEEEKGKNILFLSSYPDISTLLLVSDYLITDYSSVIFEYCLLERPMLFYAYDLEEFSEQGRGFYQNYQEYVPGPIVTSTKEIVKLLEQNQFDPDRIRDFKENNYRYLDGKAAKRIYQNIFKC